MQDLISSAILTDINSSGRENKMKKLEINSKHRQDKPPVFSLILVPGVGLEPTKACARGS
jgi:hypothetical protein